MVQSVKRHIDLIIQKLVECVSMDEIIIFGSYAYGEPDDESDIDICVIVSNQEINKRLLLKKIRKIISPLMEYPLDILVYDKSDFYNRACINTTLEYKISMEGVKVYGQYSDC